jgi:hypothetical protein
MLDDFPFFEAEFYADLSEAQGTGFQQRYDSFSDGHDMRSLVRKSCSSNHFNMSNEIPTASFHG